MESSTRSPLFRALLVLGLCLVAAVSAQDRTRARIKFNKIETFTLPTPEYKESTHSKAKREYDWLQIYAEYEASGGTGGWLDQLELHWHVLVKEPDGRFILLQTKAVYVDVETKGESHSAAVYIRPGFMRRYFGRDRIPRADIWVRVEAVVNGQVVDNGSYSRSKEPAANWWQAKEPTVKLVPDALLTRDQTPFAPLDYDFYEHLKPVTGNR